MRVGRCSVPCIRERGAHIFRHSAFGLPRITKQSAGMCSFKAMPCINNSRVVILNCFNPSPIRATHPRFLFTLWGGTTFKVFTNARIPKQIGKWRSSSEAYRGPQRAALPGCWGLNGGRSISESCGSSVRTFASSPDGSDGSEVLKNGKAEAEKALGKGLLVQAAEAMEEKLNKPEICTADELHYVAVAGTNWRLALWRYLPPPNAPKRNHPLLMLSGIGTNATGFDLDPSVSMARHMSGAGFDTWILEVRGAGLSKSEDELAEEGQEESESRDGALVENKTATEDSKVEPSTKKSSEPIPEEGGVADQKAADYEQPFELSLRANGGGSSWEAWKTATRLSNTILKLSEKLSKLLTAGQSRILSNRFIDSVSGLFEDTTLSKGISGLRERLASLLQTQESNSAVVSQIADLRKRLAHLLEDGHGAVSPRVANLQERLSSTADDFQKMVDLIAKYDWDFDNYLEEDVPTAMEYVRNQTMPVDGKILSLGHSMGGIVLYALLSTRGDKSGLVGAVAIASALDYQCSNTSLKLLLPLTDPAQALNVPVVPLGALMTAVNPLITRPPYALAWLAHQISAKNMMPKELFSKLVLNNFGTIPVKLLLHLISVFQPGGLANRDGTVKYKENIGKVTVPVLAVAGNQDLICPEVAVLDTVDVFSKETITYKCFGGENGRNYGHYDLVCSLAGKEEVFPAVLDFLLQNDKLKMDDEVKTDDKVKIGVKT